MTRDEAADTIYDLRKKAAGMPTIGCGVMMGEAVFLADVMVALGVLNLDVSLSAAPAPPSRCEPPREHQDKQWHWLRDSKKDGRLVPAEWCFGRWNLINYLPIDGIQIPPEQCARHGWRYVGPCLLPEEKP